MVLITPQIVQETIEDARTFVDAVETYLQAIGHLADKQREDA
jgi:hypothetical protein